IKDAETDSTTSKTPIFHHNEQDDEIDNSVQSKKKRNINRCSKWECMYNVHKKERKREKGRNSSTNKKTLETDKKENKNEQDNNAIKKNEDVTRTNGKEKQVNNKTPNAGHDDKAANDEKPRQQQQQQQKVIPKIEIKTTSTTGSDSTSTAQKDSKNQKSVSDTTSITEPSTVSTDKDKAIINLKQNIHELQEVLHNKEEHIKTLELSNESIRNTLLMTQNQYFKLQQEYETLNKRAQHNRTHSGWD
ncbi:hypothetical protein RFI_03430, partial [Reticulomyxa filosa]